MRYKLRGFRFRKTNFYNNLKAFDFQKGTRGAELIESKEDVAPDEHEERQRQKVLNLK